MSEPLRGVVVCHGELAEALVDAAESISGVTGVLQCRSPTAAAIARPSSDGSREALDGQPGGRVRGLACGSCLFAVLKRLRTLRGVKVVTGVNLAMLVDFVFHRSLDAEAAAEHAMAAGTRAIRTP